MIKRNLLATTELVEYSHGEEDTNTNTAEHIPNAGGRPKGSTDAKRKHNTDSIKIYNSCEQSWHIFWLFYLLTFFPIIFQISFIFSNIWFSVCTTFDTSFTHQNIIINCNKKNSNIKIDSLCKWPICKANIRHNWDMENFAFSDLINV